MENRNKVKKSDRTKTRLLDAAVKAFGFLDQRDVAIADIAREAEMTPQGVYRYFKGKRELWFAALQHDIESLQNAVLKTIEGHPLPSLSGAIWYEYSKRIHLHPMATRVVPSRSAEVLEFIAKLESTTNIFRLIEHEAILGQKYGVLRQDVSVESMMAGSKYIYGNLLVPMLFENKYNSPEWLEAAMVLVGNGFYPAPDLSSPEKIKEFEAKIADLGMKILAEQNQ